jgi:hypothetical protein
MSNIQGARGMTVPMFQPAGSKGDGGGNGSGGMYFGQEEPQEEQQPSYNQDFYGFDDFFNNEVPYIPPVEPKAQDALTSWKNALANMLYENISKTDFLAAGMEQPQ